MEEDLRFKEYNIKLKQSKRAKYLKLSVNKFGEVHLTAPGPIPSMEIEKFLNEHEPWLANTLQRLPRYTKIDIKDGATIEILSEVYTIVFREHGARIGLSSYLDEPSRRIYLFSPDFSSVDKDVLRSELIKLLIKYARKQTLSATREFARRGELAFNRISIREQHTRWGSCSSNGNLNYNWKIVLAPVEVFNYVIAHEVAHLKEHNHSEKFWTFLERIYPQHRPAKLWLKRNAHLLEII